MAVYNAVRKRLKPHNTVTLVDKLENAVCTHYYLLLSTSFRRCLSHSLNSYDLHNECTGKNNQRSFPFLFSYIVNEATQTCRQVFQEQN